MLVNTEIADCYQGLFNHFSTEHNLTLTITEMDEIIRQSLNTVGLISDYLGSTSVETRSPSHRFSVGG